MAETRAVAWEYLFLWIVGHNKPLSEADNMLVTTSDGHWDQARMATSRASIVAVLNELGRQGWEMVNSSGYVSVFNLVTPSVAPSGLFEAMFKRRLRSG